MPPIGTVLGLGPENLEGNQTQSGSLIPFQWETYETPLLDLTQPLSMMEMLPARPGHVPIPIGLETWLIEFAAGVQTVPLQFNLGSSPARTNYVAANTSGPSNADVNGANPPSLTSGFAGISISTSQLIVNTPVLLDITAGAQGTNFFKLLGRLVLIVWWTPI